MQKNESILEVARRIVELEEQLKTITGLKEKAFIPCNPNAYYKLDELYNYLVAWSEIANWTHYKEERYGSLTIKNYTDLSSKFNLLERAIINRTEFCDSSVIKEACEAVNNYIDKLSKEIISQRQKLSTLYNQFAKNTGDLSFIFKEPKVQHIIFDKILFS